MPDQLDPTVGPARGRRGTASLMAAIADAGVDLLARADGAVAFLLDGRILRTVATRGSVTGQVGEEVALAGTLAAEAFARRAPVVCSMERLRRRALDGPTRSIIVAPLFDGVDPVGVIGVMSDRPDAFGDDDSTLLGRACALTETAFARPRDAGERLPGATDAAGDRHDDPERRLRLFLSDVAQPNPTDATRARRRIQRARAADGLRSAVQPIVDLGRGRLVAAEALLRFADTPRRSPDVWFDDARSVGLGVELEADGVRSAAVALRALPELPLLTVNVSYAMLVSGRLPGLIPAGLEERVMIELTEHEPVADYGRARRAIAGLREDGVGFAIDDVGAGYASMRHVAELAPDWVKFDRVYIERAERDPSWATLTEGLIEAAGRLGVATVAEGIESESQYSLARGLGFTLGQGYWIARPGAPADLTGRLPHLPGEPHELPRPVFGQRPAEIRQAEIRGDGASGRRGTHSRSADR